MKAGGARSASVQAGRSPSLRRGGRHVKGGQQLAAPAARGICSRCRSCCRPDPRCSTATPAASLRRADAEPVQPAVHGRTPMSRPKALWSPLRSPAGRPPLRDPLRHCDVLRGGSRRRAQRPQQPSASADLPEAGRRAASREPLASGWSQVQRCSTSTGRCRLCSWHFWQHRHLRVGYWVWVASFICVAAALLQTGNPAPPEPGLQHDVAARIPAAPVEGASASLQACPPQFLVHPRGVPVRPSSVLRHAQLHPPAVHRPAAGPAARPPAARRRPRPRRPSAAPRGPPPRFASRHSSPSAPSAPPWPLNTCRRPRPPPVRRTALRCPRRCSTRPCDSPCNTGCLRSGPARCRA